MFDHKRLASLRLRQFTSLDSGVLKKKQVWRWRPRGDFWKKTPERRKSGFVKFRVRVTQLFPRTKENKHTCTVSCYSYRPHLKAPAKVHWFTKNVRRVGRGFRALDIRRGASSVLCTRSFVRKKRERDTHRGRVPSDYIQSSSWIRSGD